mgnify:CR=1 FL=1
MSDGILGNSKTVINDLIPGATLLEVIGSDTHVDFHPWADAEFILKIDGSFVGDFFVETIGGKIHIAGATACGIRRERVKNIVDPEFQLVIGARIMVEISFQIPITDS